MNKDLNLQITLADLMTNPKTEEATTTYRQLHNISSVFIRVNKLVKAAEKKGKTVPLKEFKFAFEDIKPLFAEAISLVRDLSFELKVKKTVNAIAHMYGKDERILEVENIIRSLDKRGTPVMTVFDEIMKVYGGAE